MRGCWKTLCLGLLLTLGACGTMSMGGNGPKALRVGSSGTYPPFTFAEAGILKGIHFRVEDRTTPLYPAIMPSADYLGSMDEYRANRDSPLREPSFRLGYSFRQE